MKSILCAIFWILSSSWAFNLDIESLVRHRGRPGSMFGFTIAQHSFSNQNWIMVGAPEDQSNQPSVVRGGAVYRCDVSSDNSCEQVVFDRNGNIKDTDGEYIDSKSNQWFGATLTSTNGTVLACAPRYVYTQSTGNEERRDPVGTCWLAKDQLKEAREFAPCRNRDWGYHRHGHCQGGFGAALSTDGTRLYIGSPGSTYWQGQVHSIAASTKLHFVPPRVITITPEGKVHSQNTHNRADVISSLDGPEGDDDNYLGYFVTSGRFEGGLKAPAPSDIAVAAPRSDGLRGKVVLFTYNMTIIGNITGEQLGSYFGYSMASCDIDADGLDDLIVGAPMYSHNGNHDGFYETGRIYVFYGGREDDRHIREGDKNNRARFGHSIACLGDVNKDGYNDFAVGAPYGKEGEHGEVYIYHGSRLGVREKYSQVIKAQEIPGNPLTFGFSVAGGIDMDRNQYPDLSVGAYESDQAFLFKARPVVQMISSVNFDSASKLVSLSEKNCTLKDGSRVPCIKMDACLRYEGLGVDSRLDFEIQIILDARKPKSPRLAFLSEESHSTMNQTVRLDKGKLLCNSYWVYLKNNIRDKLTSLDAELWYSLTPSRITRSLNPVLNSDETLSAKDSLTIQKNCGKDNVCIPDLRLIASPSVEKYVLGSGKRLEIEVEVQNEGEDAFESTFHLAVPSGLNYVKIERKDESEREIPVQCSPPSFNNNNTLLCDIGNPLPHDKLVRFMVLLQPFLQKSLNSTYNFTMFVNSTNPERGRTVSDNLVSFNIPIWVVTELAISGSSRPVDVYYNSSQYLIDSESEITKESEIGPQVAHLYTITNKGPSEFLKAKATILWPSNTLSGDPLLYLLEEPETSGDVHCYVENGNYNVKKVKVDRKGKSFFDSELGEASGLVSAKGSSSSSSSSDGSYSRSSSSSSSWSSSSSSGSRVNLSREDRIKFEDEIRRREEEAAARETGDGSERHLERAKGRWEEDSNHYSRNGGRLESGSYSRGSETTTRERGRTEHSGIPTSDSRTYEEETHSHRSSHSHSGGSGGSGTRSQSNERTSTSWSGNRGSGSRTETKWKTEEDGVVRNGSSVVEHGGAYRPGTSSGETVDKTYDRSNSRTSHTGRHRNGNSGLNNSSGERRYNWRVEGDEVTRREDSDSVATGDSTLEVSSNRRGGTTSGEQEGWSTRRGASSGATRKSEERHTERNTTWTSGGRPVTSEHDSWRKEQDGVVIGSGDHRRTYEGSADLTKSELESRLKEQLDRRTAIASHGGSSSVNSEIDHNIIGSGDTKYIKEWEENYNTTWGSSTGGKPVTVAKTKWKIEEDGKVRTGDDSRTFEGVPPGMEGTNITIPSSSHTGGNRRVEINGGGGKYGEGIEGSSESRHESSHHETRTHVRGGAGTYKESNYDSGSRGRTDERSRAEEREEERRRSGSASFGGNHREEDDIEERRRGGGTYGTRVIETSRTVTTHHRGGSVNEQERGRGNENTDERSGSARRTEGEYGETHRESEGGSSESHSTSSGHHRHWSSSTTSDAERNSGSHRRNNAGRGESETRTHNAEDSYDSNSRTHVTGGESDRRGNRNQEGESYYSESERRSNVARSEESNSGLSGRRTHGSGSGSSAAASVGESAGASSSFDFGAVAIGPKDGKARTYVSDLGILKEGSSGSSGSSSSSGISNSQRSGAEGGSRHHHSSSRERHYSFGGESGSKDEGQDSYSSSRGSSGGSETRYSSGRASSHSSSRNFEGDPDLDPEYENRQSGGGSSSSYSWSKSYSSSDGTQPKDSVGNLRSISNSDDRQGFRHYRRERREADDDYENYNYDDYDEDDTPKKCAGPVQCTRIICNIGALKKDQEVHVAIRSRLWVATIKKIAPHIDTLVGSEMTAKVTLLPTIGRPSSKTMTKNSTEVKTKIMAEPVAAPDVVPLWIVVLSAVCGALILMLLVYILYKLGFFKRNRPEPGSSRSEKTPLNRNGHYQGDEHL